MGAAVTAKAHPWRDVTAVSEHDQRVSLFAPNSRTARYWELDLTCGHTVSRLIRKQRYTADGDRLARRRDLPDLPPPRRVRCNQCPRITTGANA